MDRRFFLKSGAALGAVALFARPSLAAAAAEMAADSAKRKKVAPLAKVVKTDEEWRRVLSAEQYRVLRQKGTEAPYSSPLNGEKGRGTFQCAGCALPLFSSKAKFESGTGWPSFWTPLAKRNVREDVDDSLGARRTEVLCARCDGHLGHVFDDGPRPTGLRYCMNGVALKFVKG